MCETAHRRSQTRAPGSGRRVNDSLALEQHVGLSEQRHLGSQAPLAVGQVADVASQLLLALPARLQLALQPPQLLIQPERIRKVQLRRKKAVILPSDCIEVKFIEAYLVICSAW